MGIQVAELSVLKLGSSQANFLGQFTLAGLHCYSADTFAKFEIEKKHEAHHLIKTHGTGYLLKMHLGNYGPHLKMDYI